MGRVLGVGLLCFGIVIDQAVLMCTRYWWILIGLNLQLYLEGSCLRACESYSISTFRASVMTLTQMDPDNRAKQMDKWPQSWRWGRPIICNKLLVEFDLRQNFGYLFGLFPFVTQVNTHLNEIANDVCLGRWILFAVGLMRFTNQD